MDKKNTKYSKKNPPKTSVEKLVDFIKLVISTLIAVFLIRTFIISTYQIPTSSMENTLLIGDHIIANKFVYGVRSADWIGIPYTKIGFHVPFFRLPGFRNPKPGDIIIFKYPRDTRDSYVKRCIAVSGDSVEIRDKQVFVNDSLFVAPSDAKVQNTDWNFYNKSGQNKNNSPYNMRIEDIYPPRAGSRDNYGPVRVPAKGDTFHFSNSNRLEWYSRFTIMLYEGHKIKIFRNNRWERLTVENREDWKDWILRVPVKMFKVDGASLDQYVYRVNNDLYFMMGDNRDWSLDSRYWGFVPRRYVLGEPIVIYWSWNKKKSYDEIYNKIRWGRLLRLIH